jgi:hypothetical protein
MRPYNSETDYQTLLGAVQRVGKAGGFLTAVKANLNAAGVAFPGNFNSDRGQAAMAIDADCTRALAEIQGRLEYLRGELDAERISLDELHELRCLAACIDKDDVQLLEAAGVPEFPESA